MQYFWKNISPNRNTKSKIIMTLKYLNKKKTLHPQ